MKPARSESVGERILYAFADAFMVLMLSRPATGSLRQTRVTTVSLALSLATAAVLVAAGVALVGGGSGLLRLLVAVVLFVLALGSLSVAVVAFRQRTG